MEEAANRKSSARFAVTLALVFAGCLVGARFGTWLQFPDIGAAVLFPPYAIVVAALWHTPVRRWWLVLVVASAGTFLPHADTRSPSFVLCAELVNHARAVLAVLVFRWVARGAKVDSLSGFAAYLLAVVLVAPIVAALGGAGLVSWNGGDFWVAWKEWALSNSITGLTIAPGLVLGMAPTKPTRAQAIECSVMFALLGGVGFYVFQYGYELSPMHQAHLYWALPFLLWAAIRFGARGTSLVIVVVTVASAWGAMHGRGPFRNELPIENLLELQVFLVGVAIPVLLLAVTTDQQRRTAAALTESRQQYQSIVEDQSELICRCRPDGTCTFANRAYREAFPAQSSACVELFDLTKITPASPNASYEIQTETATGSRWQQWTVRGLYDAAGVLVEYQGVGRDITDRKSAEDEHRELEGRKSVEAVLRENDRRKDEFLGMLGHELRNPLAPIGLALELLLTSEPDSEDADWARESMKRQLGHMKRLVDELLDISRVTRGKIQLRYEAVNLLTMITNAVEATRQTISEGDHTLVVEMPPQPILMRADSVRLTQIITNLVSNAAKYTDRGGRIEISVARDGELAQISVRDNGIGLAPESLDMIFELFAQLPEARDRARGGLGVGLTLVKKLVELHGGTVEARSEGRGKGTEIIVRLPATPAVEDAGVPITVAPSAIRPLRILAIDDNVDIANGLAAVLQMWGHTVLTANDGEAALEIATSFAPEVVLVDLQLPRVSGLEVARRLRETPVASAMLVSMTGFGQESLRIRSTEAGFNHHLVKPLDLDSLKVLLDGARK